MPPKRLDLLALVVALGALAVSLALFHQNRQLRKERDDAVAAALSMGPAAAVQQPAEEVARTEEALKSHESALRALEAELAALKKAAPSKEAPPAAGRKPRKAPAEEEVHRNPLQVGQEPTKEMLAALGLDPLGETALREALRAEQERVQESLRRLYLEMIDPLDRRVNERSGQEMVMALADSLKPEIEALKRLPHDERERIEKREASLEELLGEENRISRVARSLHAARAATYDDLARRLTSEQVEAIRRGWLPEGTFKWPNDVDIELGPAPADLRK